MAYSVIERHIWHDEKFRAMSRDARDLFLYLLTSPHSNRLGMYVLDRFYAASDVQMGPTEVDAALAELQAAGRIDYDPRTRLVLIRRFLKHNPMKNPNVVTAACGDLLGLPFSERLWQQLADAVSCYGKSFYEPLRKQLAKQLGDKTLNHDPDPDPIPLTTDADASDGEPSRNEDAAAIVDVTSDTEWAAFRTTLFAPLRKHVWKGKVPPERVPANGRKWDEGRELSYVREWIRAGFLEPHEAEAFLRVAPVEMQWRDAASLSWLGRDEHIPRIREIVGRVRKDSMSHVGQVLRAG